MAKNVEQLIGVQIAKIRKDREITQEKLAELIDVTTETVSRLERGVSIPSLKTLEKVSRSLHVSFKDLFDFEYPQKSKISVVEKESKKIITYLQTKRGDDIKMSYKILKTIFDQIDKNYTPIKIRRHRKDQFFV